MSARRAGTSGSEVISILKEDYLLVFECKGELKRFLRRNAGGIWIKIHLNPNTEVWVML
jgi:hypothetical protein